MMMVAQPYEKGVLYQLPIADLRPDPNQPRKVIDPAALSDLKDSIAQFGILTPILFRVGEEGLPVIVSGERRWQAAQALGLLTIPGICVEGNFSEIALVENLQRQDLTAVEEAEALQRLIDQEGYTQGQLGAIVGKARTTVSDVLSINRLPEQIRDECRGNHQVSRNILIEIARKKQERGMLSAYAAYKEKLERVARPRQKKPPNDPAAALDWVQKTAAKIESLDAAAWTEDESAAFRSALADLQTVIDAFLNPPSELA